MNIKILYKMILLPLVAVLWLSPAYSATKDPIYTGYFNNKAVSGYDVVAYFTESKPVEGHNQYMTQYQGADWYFSSPENLALFKENPEKYAPQYGGYCAFAIAQGSLASVDPEQWTIYHGKLYLNYSRSVKNSWLADKQNLIKTANQKWPEILQ